MNYDTKYLSPLMETNNNINIHKNGESVNLIIKLWYTDFLPKPESKIYVILTSRIKRKVNCRWFIVEKVYLGDLLRRFLKNWTKVKRRKVDKRKVNKSG